MILGEDGQKMSKTRGDVVNPDDVVAAYGAAADPKRVFADLFVTLRRME